VSTIERNIKAAHPEVTRMFVEAQDFHAHRRLSAGPAEPSPSARP
jgi:hypothetical protein